MAPKKANNATNVASDEKASVWLADALRLTGDEITINISTLAAARGIPTPAVAKQVSRLREKLPGLNIKTISKQGTNAFAARGVKGGKKAGAPGEDALGAAINEQVEEEEDASAGAGENPGANEKKRAREMEEAAAMKKVKVEETT